MKTLKDFILESSEKSTEKSMSKTIVLNFEDFDDGKEKIKEFAEKYNSLDFVTIENDVMTINLTNDNLSDITELYDDLKSYCSSLKNSSKRSSNEQYAQKIKKFTESVNSIDNFKNEVEKSEEE